MRIEFGASVFFCKTLLSFCLVAGFPGFAGSSYATPGLAPEDKPISPVYQGVDGRLMYTKDKSGNRIPDFSYCGYKASEQLIPTVPVRVVVPAKEGDATLRIQSAIDYVASLPLDQDGFRGAVLLGKGIHSVEGNLHISASGVVLRGCGTGAEGTVLQATGTDRRTFIRFLGKKDRQLSPEIRIVDKYVPVNAMEITLETVSGLKNGDFIRIHRPSTAEWIDTLNCSHFGGGIPYLGWKPGSRDIFWDRKIKSVRGNQITIDVPLTTAIEDAFGGGRVARYEWPGQISQVGIENIALKSAYSADNEKDEDHCWTAVTIENCFDAWVRQTTFAHFAGSAVAVMETARNVTVEDCKSIAPISEIGGQRRNTFFTSGQMTLFQRCYSESGYHDFAVGACAAGPNAFMQCESNLSYSFSGAIDSWSSGILFDVVNIDGNALVLKNRMEEGKGAGWCAANSVLWQCTAARVDCFSPPTAVNWAFGTWAQFSGNGYWGDSNNQIRPRSLFYAQLADRTGKNVTSQARLFPMDTEASTSPSVEMAALLTSKAKDPSMLLTEWIDLASIYNPISSEAKGAKAIDLIGIKLKNLPGKAPLMQIQNGWLVRGNTLLTGKRLSVPYWNVIPVPAVTRYVPGRIGAGLTDDLNELTDSMVSDHILSLEQNYGLWYDRRRDDHERIRRMDGDVWAPFYELPFARSGKGTAWDGLSRYDLTKYNAWYWSRLQQFADLADQKGLVLVHQNYFQHNIIEAGAHFADFPWRPANNINNTGFPEPVPYAGDKRIFMAEQFYDVDHQVRRPLHESYIRQCLDNFVGNSGVIQYIGEEFTGPLHFVRFWLETVRKWESETGKSACIALAVTKDVQDSVLADPELASVVDLIDIRYWFYREDQTTYSPAGGQNLAPRQHARLVKPGNASFDQVYRAVHEYRNRFPEKAVTYSADGYQTFGWAVFMAGGSLPVLPVIQAKGFLESASGMTAVAESGKNRYLLATKSGDCILYLCKGNKGEVNLKEFRGEFLLTQINPSDGSILVKPEPVSGGKVISVESTSGDVVFWLVKYGNI